MGLTYRNANSYHSGKDSKRETFENSWAMGRWIHGSPVIEGTMSYNLPIYHISCISPYMYICIYIMYISWLCKTCSSSSWNNQSTSELGMSKTVSLRCRQTFVGHPTKWMFIAWKNHLIDRPCSSKPHFTEGIIISIPKPSYVHQLGYRFGASPCNREDFKLTFLPKHQFQRWIVPTI
jgi:hypothetical protein